MPGLIGKKVGMTRVIQDDGQVIPVTVISVPDATVTQVKTADKDGYEAVVLGIDPMKKPTKTISTPKIGRCTPSFNIIFRSPVLITVNAQYARKPTKMI